MKKTPSPSSAAAGGTEIKPERRPWNVAYYREILARLQGAGYRSMTFSEYHAASPAERQAKPTILLRKDVDDRPDRIPALMDADADFGFRSTYFFHVHATYNCFHYDTYDVIRRLIERGNEIGLHSNFVEFAKYFGEEPRAVIERERAMLEAIAGQPINGHACHRDVNYVYNSLPFLDAAGASALGFRWSAYDPVFCSDGIVYINEGLAPHLGWRGASPEEAIATGRNICLLLHPHWWHLRFHTGL